MPRSRRSRAAHASVAAASRWKRGAALVPPTGDSRPRPTRRRTTSGCRPASLASASMSSVSVGRGPVVQRTSATVVVGVRVAVMRCSAPLPRVELRHLRELLEELALLLRRLLRDHDLHDRVEVAGAAARIGVALAAQAQPPAARRARRNLHAALAVERLDLDLGPERRLPRRHRQVDVEVAAIQPKARVPADAHAQEEVARGAAADARPALTGEPDALAVADAARDVDLEVAPVAEREAPPPAARGLLERELELGLPVAAAHREAVEAAAAAPAAPSAAAEQALEEVVDVALAELDADVVEVAAPAAALAPAAARPAAGASPGALGLLRGAPVRAEAVVLGALLGVAEDLVGLGDLLEAVLGARLLVDIRVVLAGEPPVGTADLVLARSAGDAERLVVVAGADCGHQLPVCGRRDTATCAGRSTRPSTANPARRTSTTVRSGTSSVSRTSTASWRSGSNGSPGAPMRCTPWRARIASICSSTARMPWPRGPPSSMRTARSTLSIASSHSRTSASRASWTRRSTSRAERLR